MHCLTLSQCEDLRAGLIWEDVGALTTARAREFWICWRLFRCAFGRYNTEANEVNSARQSGAAANLAAKTRRTNMTTWPGLVFYPVAIKTVGTWHYQTINHRTGRENWKTHHQHHWQCKRDGVSVSAAVCGTSKGKRGFFSKYLRCQLVRCNPLFSLLLNLCVCA